MTRLASKEIFSPSNEIYREVGGAKDLSAPRVSSAQLDVDFENLNKNIQIIYKKTNNTNCVNINCMSFKVFAPCIVIQLYNINQQIAPFLN